MTPKRFTAFRIDEELLEGLEALKARDGIPQAEAVRRAIAEFLAERGIKLEKKAERKRVVARKRS